MRNYYTVLDQDHMRIGLSANLGSEAEISPDPFSSSIVVSVIMGILGSIITIVFLFFLYKHIDKKIIAHRKGKFASSVGQKKDIHKEI